MKNKYIIPTFCYRYETLDNLLEMSNQSEVLFAELNQIEYLFVSTEPGFGWPGAIKVW